MNDAYAIARLGGKNAGLLRQLEKMSLSQVQRTGKSLSENIALHRSKVKNPSDYVPDWDSRNDQYRTGLVLHWNKEIRTFEDQMVIIERVLYERSK